MINKNLHKISALFILSLCFTIGANSFLYGQTSKDFDKRIKEGTRLMYENPDEAIRIGTKLLSDAKDDIDYKIKAYKLISDGYSSKRNYQKSLENVIKANQILHLSKNELLKILITNKLGILYHQLNLYDKSVQYLDQAEDLILKYPVRDSALAHLGTNYIVRGFIYKEKLDCQIAIEYFDKGVNAYLQSKSDNSSGISIAKYNKGNCYISMSNFPKAKENFELAIVYAKKISANSLQAFAYKGLAQVYIFEGKYDIAVKTLEEALNISKDVNDLILNQEIYKGLSESYLALNQWDMYKEFHFKYLNMKKLNIESERKSISDSLIEKKSELDGKFKSSISKFYWVYFLISAMIIGVIIFVINRIKNAKKEIETLENKITLLQNPKTI